MIYNKATTDSNHIRHSYVKRGEKRDKLRWLCLIFVSVSSLCLLLLAADINFAPSAPLHDTEDIAASAQVHPRAKRFPNAIIVGVRKGGTRALLKFLQLNRAIRAAQNEVHFFDRPQNFRKGYDWYRTQMPETNDKQLTIEKSPAYFVTQGVPEKIKTLNPSIRIIVIMRDPVTRLISDYSQLVSNRFNAARERDWFSSGDGNKLSSAQDEDSFWGASGKSFVNYVLNANGTVNEHRLAVRAGMYTLHLERWMAVFPRASFHFVDGEQLITKPHIELNKVEQFLGLEPAIQAKHFVFNQHKNFYCIATNHTSESNILVQSKAFVQKSDCLSRNKGRRHVYVSDQLKSILRDFYAPFNGYLFSLTNINFTQKNN